MNKIPAMTYFRTCGHYHRPCELNDRVRNGNACDLAGLVTGNSTDERCPASPIADRSVWHAERRHGPNRSGLPVVESNAES